MLGVGAYKIIGKIGRVKDRVDRLSLTSGQPLKL